MRIRFQWTWLLTLLPAAAFAVLALNLPLVQPLDEAVSLMVQGWRSSPLTEMMKVFSQLAHPIVLVVFSFVLVFAVRQRKHWAPIFTNLAISVMLNLSLKEVFARPRPMVVSRLVLEHCDAQVALPLMGKIASLNASVAAGILMYEVLRRRIEA